MFICEFWDVFRNTSFIEPSEKLLFYVQVAEFQPPDTVKNYLTGAFQACYTRSRSSHSKAFIYLKSQKTVCEGVNLLWGCEMPTCKLTKKKLFHTSSFMHIAFIFSEYITILLPERLWKFESIISFRKCKRKVVLLVNYLFN